VLRLANQTDRLDYNPIGAFYDSQSAQYDNAQSVAQYTGRLSVGNMSIAVSIESIFTLLNRVIKCVEIS
jgi:hypothetical protein